MTVAAGASTTGSAAVALSGEEPLCVPKTFPELPQGCPSKSSLPGGEGCWTLAAGAAGSPSLTPAHTETPTAPMALPECSQQDHQAAFALWSPVEPLTLGLSPQKRLAQQVTEDQQHSPDVFPQEL